MSTIEVRQYRTQDGKVPVLDWLAGFRDRIARARINARLDRLALGLRG